MMRVYSAAGISAVCLLAISMTATADEAELRLVPFPKQVQLGAGKLALAGDLKLAVSPGDAGAMAASMLAKEIEACVGKAPTLVTAAWPAGAPAPALVLYPTGAQPRLEALVLPAQGGTEGYALSAAPERLLIHAAGTQGLLHGVQTARQLIRANLTNHSLPEIAIQDWPSLRYRGFQDDITRGPSSRLSMLETEVVLSSEFKMNFFTYYMEHQYAFTKHPAIGPADGSLTPGELRDLVAFAQPYGVDILGCQQSFGHSWQILRHKEYEHLRETSGILCPVKEETYQLLDELYAEQVPLTPFPMFNICCDETEGLGTGPSKELADKIGVGGVYAQHLRRVHDLLKDKYGKRMMMWGDIILRHPENLKEIPQDTVMLTWGYHAGDSFENQITPFAKSGYDFFVCPGVSCWSRILPDFACANKNIRNFVRDGAKLGALGMLNTTWDDDGENFNAPNWHGALWGAECAWNGSTTEIDAFNRRIGAVLFGETADHFGQAIALLTRTHTLPGFDGMMDRRFWALDVAECPVSEAASRAQAQALLDLVNPAIEHLQQAKRDAKFNARILDYFLFGARRMQLMGERALAFLDAAHAAEKATQPGTDKVAATAALTQALTKITAIRDAHAALKPEYETLWLEESKPFALDNVLKRFDRAVTTYDGVVNKLTQAVADVEVGKAAPSVSTLGMRIVEFGVRQTRPSATADKALAVDASWVAPEELKGRMGLRVASGRVARSNLPVEIDLPAGVATGNQGFALFELDATAGNKQTPVPCQVDRAADKTTLVFVVPGAFAANTERSFLVYFGPGHVQSTANPGAVTCSDAPNGMTCVENSRVRLLIGTEGAHVYRWEVKDANNVDLTEPGEKDWAGFADLGGPSRNAKSKIDVLSKGPVMCRLHCTDELGTEKLITAYAGMACVDMVLNTAVNWYWNYDDAKLFGADGPTPGNFLFSNGKTGPIQRQAKDEPGQVKNDGVNWSAKTRQDGLLLALITPEVKTRHTIGPGGGMGGVGIEWAQPVTHFVTFGGIAKDDPKALLDTLQNTLSLRDQAEVTLFALEKK
ncbi:MAG: hypothetical protein A3K19_08990 [Lentisphaerae bacterium RIFOXYB12_FULL_65_16]|nr:MAG: hypothetical protein A3K18_11990 [Lentisphaerae bacterium RIFOXYA12_64_32]OGV90828.1 MAG: hypothetical protein A3K19_08990 [Lentisphaerae bacterium RIFOXYB12_FULL_65_16]